jgi:hypothetical protein
LNKLQQEELRFEQERLNKENIERQKQELLFKMQKEKERIKQETLDKQI